jgi:hypothetical protein
VRIRPQQSNSIHVSVGVIIAVVANTWTGRIIPPLLWGLIWCVRLALLPGGSRRSYPAEYLRAAFSALAAALVLGSLKAIFRYLLLN